MMEKKTAAGDYSTQIPLFNSNIEGNVQHRLQTNVKPNNEINFDDSLITSGGPNLINNLHLSHIQPELNPLFI